jgi:fructokinase
MAKSSIVIFGEALVDLFKNASVVGGAPFNIARHLSGFGLHPLLISAIGNDVNGSLVQEQIQQFQLDPQGVQVLALESTGLVQVHENANGHQFEIMPNCAYDFIQSKPALDFIKAVNPSKLSAILYHGTLGLRGDVSYETFQAICQQLKTNKSNQLFLDINWRAGHVEEAVAMDVLQKANIVKLSIEELEMVLPWFNVSVSCEKKLPTKDSLDNAIAALMQQLSAQLLLVTYGDLGSAAFDKQGICLASATASKLLPVVDTVGAGDAFSSVMLYALTQGWAMDLTLRRANDFAAKICNIRGATPNNLAFYSPFLTHWQDKMAAAQ